MDVQWAWVESSSLPYPPINCFCRLLRHICRPLNYPYPMSIMRWRLLQPQHYRSKFYNNNNSTSPWTRNNIIEEIEINLDLDQELTVPIHDMIPCRGPDGLWLDIDEKARGAFRLRPMDFGLLKTKVSVNWIFCVCIEMLLPILSVLLLLVGPTNNVHPVFSFSAPDEMVFVPYILMVISISPHHLSNSVQRNILQPNLQMEYF